MLLRHRCLPGHSRSSTRTATVIRTRAIRDVVALGNLCCDVVIEVPVLPPADTAARAVLLQQLTAAQHDQGNWEVGGNANFLIAAARLGLHAASIGHLGSDAYGDFMRDVLQDEAVADVQGILGQGSHHSNEGCEPMDSDSSSHPGACPPHSHAGIPSPAPLPSIASSSSRTGTLLAAALADTAVSGPTSASSAASSDSAPSLMLDTASSAGSSASSSAGCAHPGQPASNPTPTSTSSDMHGQTLVCFVLVDPGGKHAFCSRYDFGPWPLLAGLGPLPHQAVKMLAGTRAVFMNGFVFDELPLDTVVAAVTQARSQGAAIFFDPGPRCFTMREGSRQQALHAIMDLSDVILMTEEEAATVTGHHDADAAACSVLARPAAVTQWCVVKQGAQGALLRIKGEAGAHTAPGFKVPVEDTVGCGDSFAAAIVLGYINKHPAGTTLALANAVGAATATGRGAGRNVARASMVMSLLQQGCAAEGETGQHRHGALGVLQASLASKDRQPHSTSSRSMSWAQ